MFLEHITFLFLLNASQANVSFFWCFLMFLVNFLGICRFFSFSLMFYREVDKNLRRGPLVEFGNHWSTLPRNVTFIRVFSFATLALILFDLALNITLGIILIILAFFFLFTCTYLRQFSRCVLGNSSFAILQFTKQPNDFVNIINWHYYLITYLASLIGNWENIWRLTIVNWQYWLTVRSSFPSFFSFLFFTDTLGVDLESRV